MASETALAHTRLQDSPSEAAAEHGARSAGHVPYSDNGVGADTVTRSISRTRPR
jgi:hypothetical protein